MRKRRLIFGIAAALIMAAGILPGYGRDVKAAEISDFNKYVTSVDELSVPEGTRITALGEATHGNREFQQLKREVFEILVRKNDVRALVIEGDFGGCTEINNYIPSERATGRNESKYKPKNMKRRILRP